MTIVVLGQMEVVVVGRRICCTSHNYYEVGIIIVSNKKRGYGYEGVGHR